MLFFFDSLVCFMGCACTNHAIERRNKNEKNEHLPEPPLLADVKEPQQHPTLCFATEDILSFGNEYEEAQRREEDDRTFQQFCALQTSEEIFRDQVAVEEDTERGYLLFEYEEEQEKSKLHEDLKSGTIPENRFLVPVDENLRTALCRESTIAWNQSPLSFNSDESATLRQSSSQELMQIQQLDAESARGPTQWLRVPVRASTAGDDEDNALTDEATVGPLDLAPSSSQCGGREGESGDDVATIPTYLSVVSPRRRRRASQRPERPPSVDSI
jgi:hypothetical protein